MASFDDIPTAKSSIPGGLFDDIPAAAVSVGEGLFDDIPESATSIEAKKPLAQQVKEYDDKTTFFGRIANDAKRGWQTAKQNIAQMGVVSSLQSAEQDESGLNDAVYDPVSGAKLSDIDPSIAKERAKASRKQAAAQVPGIINRAREIDAIPKRPVQAAISAAKATPGGVWEAIKADPLGAIGAYTTESLAQQVPALGLSLINPVAGAGMGLLSGGVSETGGGFFEYLAENGINVNDQAALAKAFEDPELVRRAQAYAGKRAAIIAPLDAVSAGLSPLNLIPKNLAKSQVKREAANALVAQPIVQATIGVSGDGGAQLATKGKIDDYASLAAEALGEAGSAIGESAAFAGKRGMEVVRGAPQVVTPANSPIASSGITPIVIPGALPNATGTTDADRLAKLGEDTPTAPAAPTAAAPTTETVAAPTTETGATAPTLKPLQAAAQREEATVIGLLETMRERPLTPDEQGQLTFLMTRYREREAKRAVPDQVVSDKSSTAADIDAVDTLATAAGKSVSTPGITVPQTQQAAPQTVIAPKQSLFDQQMAARGKRRRGELLTTAEIALADMPLQQSNAAATVEVETSRSRAPREIGSVAPVDATIPTTETVPLINEGNTGEVVAPTVETPPETPAAAPVVLQNRNRNTAPSIQQMNAIAAAPDYGRLSVSRDFANGAPVVFSDAELPGSAVTGKTSYATAADGRRTPVQYAVVEAADLIASNRADGSPNDGYANGAPGKLRAIAGNGRVAGLQAAYGRGTTAGYKSELTADEDHGIATDAIAGFKEPILVRIMPKESVTPDIGDVSNTTGTGQLSPVEQAQNDARRIDIAALEFNEDGLTTDSIRAFVNKMPTAEQVGLLNPDGTPTRQATDRIMSAVFAEAYGDTELITLYAQATDPDSKIVLAALADAAPAMVQLKGTGPFDIRSIVVEAAQAAVNARRRGEKLVDYAKTRDIERSDEADAILTLMADNIRSAKRIGEGLREIADGMRAAHNANTSDSMFGDLPQLTRADVLNNFARTNGKATQQSGSAQNPGNASGQVAAAETVQQGAAGPAGEVSAETDQGSTEQDGLAFSRTGDIVADGIVPDEPEYDGVKPFATKTAASLFRDKNGLDADVVEDGQGGFVLAPASRKLTLEEKRNDARRISKLNDALSRAGAPKVGPVFDPANPTFAIAKWIGRIFGVNVTVVSANPFFDGVELGRDVYLAEDNQNPVIAVVGHEVTHTLEKSDPALHQQMKDQIAQYLKDGAVERRRQWDNNLRPTDQAGNPVGPEMNTEGAENEVMSDLTGAMWLDPLFWREMINRDINLFRRVAYLFMEKATQAKQALRGSNFVAESMVKDVDAVRKIIAQTWATHLQAADRAAPGGNATPAFLRAYHGSPYRFDKFSNDNIGNGEGNQAYGYGAYFAGRKEVAEYYRRALTARDGTVPVFKKDGKELRSAVEIAQAYFTPGRIVDGYGGRDVVVGFERDGEYRWSATVQAVDANGQPKRGERVRQHSTFPEIKELTKVLKGEGFDVSQGQLYEVEIPEDNEYLLWDKRLSDQPASVREALAPFIERHIANQRQLFSGFSPEAAEREIQQGLKELTGQGIYEQAGYLEAGGDRSASEYLNKLGIAGIKYLDGTSRVQGDGSFNYVVFDDSRISIESTAFSKKEKQDDTPRDLIFTHNLSAENLLFADRRGGIPVPSLAITKQSTPLDGFGEITLIGNRDLADPKGAAGAKVYGADIYSPRYPSVEFKLDKFALKRLNALLAPFNDEGSRELYGDEIRRIDDLTSIQSFKRYAADQVGTDNPDILNWSQLKAQAQSLLERSGADERIFNGYNNNGDRKYLPHNLDNVVKILKKELRGGEGFNYGVGSVRANFTPQFKSIAEIRKNRDRLTDKATFEKVKEEIDAEFFKVSGMLQPHHPASDNFGFADTVSMTMSDSAKMGIPRALRENGFDEVPTEVQQEMVTFLNQLRTLPTEYFEAKILRSVSLSEFSGAVIPKNAGATVRKILEKNGLAFAEYDKSDRGDRARVVRTFTDRLDADKPGVLFSKKSGEIRLEDLKFSKKQFVTAEDSDLYQARTITPIDPAKVAAALDADAVARKILAKGIKVQDGDAVGVRINLNVQRNRGIAVQTIHDGRQDKKYTQSLANTGLYTREVIDYKMVVTLRNAYFNVHQANREGIASRAAEKGKMASVDGNFVDAPVSNFDGIEISFNPMRVHLFVDRENRPIRFAEEVTVYGNRVYARGKIEYYTRDTAPAKVGVTPSGVRFDDQDAPVVVNAPAVQVQSALFSRKSLLNRDEVKFARKANLSAETSPLYRKRRIDVLTADMVRDALETDFNSRRVLAKGITPKPGDLVGVRVNISVENNTGVAIQTVHAGSNREGYKNNAGFWDGEAITYQQVVVVKDAYFNVQQKRREDIAAGLKKKPMASVDGNFVRADNGNFDGIEILFNPRRVHLFVDAEGHPIRYAEEVTVLGHRAYARGRIEYYTRETAPEKIGVTPSSVRFEDESPAAASAPAQTALFSRKDNPDEVKARIEAARVKLDRARKMVPRERVEYQQRKGNDIWGISPTPKEGFVEYLVTIGESMERIRFAIEDAEAELRDAERELARIEDGNAEQSSRREQSEDDLWNRLVADSKRSKAYSTFEVKTDDDARAIERRMGMMTFDVAVGNWILMEEGTPVAIHATEDAALAEAYYENQLTEDVDEMPGQWPDLPKFSRKESAPVFYSALSRAVTSAMPKNKAGEIAPKEAQLWLASKAKEGKLFKTTELEWSGLTDWLGMQEGKVKVDDITAWLDANGVKVEETVKSGANGYSNVAVESLDSGMFGVFDIDSENQIGGDFATREEAERAAEDYSSNVDNTKYSSYTLPGGENYRELLLTLPPASLVEPVIAEGRWRLRVKQTGEFMRANGNKVIGFKSEQEAKEAIAQLSDPGMSEFVPGYKSSHWSEKNIVAHIRFNDRTDADGNKVLFIEELQSDWGQAGKKNGFVDSVDATEIARLRAAHSSLTDLIDGPFAAIRDSGKNIVDLREERKQLGQQITELEARQRSATIPTAPFVNKTESWLGLGIKRMIRWAAENGYDKVAFINGEQSADRYDLSKTLKTVKAMKSGDSATIFATDNNDRQVEFGTHKIADLADVVGKDLAEKIAAQEIANEVYRGLDLKVGGEGMKTFYDKIVPNAINDVLKKVGGGKVIPVNFSQDDGESKYTIDAEDIGADEDQEQEVVVRDSRTLDGVATLDSIAAAEAWIEKNDVLVGASTQPGFDITPAMRDIVMSGQPLFSRKEQPGLDFDAAEAPGQEGARADRFLPTALEDNRPLTKQEILTRQLDNERARKAEEKTKREADKPAPGRRVTADQVDMFNNQGALFSRKQGQRFSLPDETSLGERGNRGIQKQARFLQDSMNRVAVVQAEVAAQGGTITDDNNMMLAAERMPGRVRAATEDFRRAVVDPLGKQVKDAGLTMDELALYRYARHAPERNAYIASINPKMPDGGSGMSNADAAAVLAQARADGKEAALSALHDQLRAVSDATLLMQLDQGLITREQYDLWTTQYQDYVPLRGFEGVDEEGTVMRGARGFNVRGKETMRAMGRRSRAGDLIENVFLDYERAITRSERNQVAKTLLDFVIDNPDADLWEIDKTEIRKGIDPVTGTVRETKVVDKGEDTIGVKVAGRVVYIKLKDPLMARAFRQAGKEESGQTERFLASTFGLVNSMLRAAYTKYNPLFIPVNAIRDVQTGLVNVIDELGAGAAGKYAKNYAAAMAAAYRSAANKADRNNAMDRYFSEYRNAGGITGGYFGKDAAELRRELRRAMVRAGATPANLSERIQGLASWKATAGLFNAIEMLGETTENASRFAAYMTAREMGKSIPQAASVAKNLTTNFDRRGEWGSGLSSLYLFYNASVQGSVRTFQALKNPKVQALLGGVVAFAAGLAALNASMGDDEDGQAWWDKIPQEEKERNFILILPPGVFMPGDKQVGKFGRYIKIPMPYGFNIFPVAGYAVTDAIRHQRDPKQGRSIARSASSVLSAMIGSFSPIAGGVSILDKDNKPQATQLAQAVAPTALSAFVSLATNKDNRGRDIVPERTADIRPDSQKFFVSQTGSATQRLTAAINRATGGDEVNPGAIDLAPGEVDFLIRSYTGGIGTIVRNGVNIVSQLQANENIDSKNAPLANRFYGRIDDGIDQRLYYERSKEAIEAHKRMVNSLKAGIRIEYDEESKAMQVVGSAAETYQKALTELRKAEISVMNSKALTDQEKARRRTEIARTRAMMFGQFNKLYMEKVAPLQ